MTAIQGFRRVRGNLSAGIQKDEKKKIQVLKEVF